MDQFNEHMVRYRKEGIKYLRENIPEIQRIESLDDLQDLELVKETDLPDMVLVLRYKANTPSLFPAVRQRLLDKNVAKKHNMLHTSLRNRGTLDEFYRVTMGFYGNRLLISLDVRKLNKNP